MEKNSHLKGIMLTLFVSFLLHNGQISGIWKENIFALQCWMHKMPGSENIFLLLLELIIKRLYTHDDEDDDDEDEVLIHAWNSTT